MSICSVFDFLSLFNWFILFGTVWFLGFLFLLSLSLFSSFPLPCADFSSPSRSHFFFDAPCPPPLFSLLFCRSSSDEGDDDDDDDDDTGLYMEALTVVQRSLFVDRMANMNQTKAAAQKKTIHEATTVGRRDFTVPSAAAAAPSPPSTRARPTPPFSRTPSKLGSSTKRDQMVLTAAQHTQLKLCAYEDAKKARGEFKPAPPEKPESGEGYLDHTSSSRKGRFSRRFSEGGGSKTNFSDMRRRATVRNKTKAAGDTPEVAASADDGGRGGGQPLAPELSREGGGRGGGEKERERERASWNANRAAGQAGSGREVGQPLAPEFFREGGGGGGGVGSPGRSLFTTSLNDRERRRSSHGGVLMDEEG